MPESQVIGLPSTSDEVVEERCWLILGIMSQISSLEKLTALGRRVERRINRASERSTPRSFKLEHLRRSASMEILEGGRTGGTRRDSALVSDIVEHAKIMREVREMFGNEPKGELRGWKKGVYTRTLHAFSAHMSG